MQDIIFTNSHLLDLGKDILRHEAPGAFQHPHHVVEGRAGVEVDQLDPHSQFDPIVH